MKIIISRTDKIGDVILTLPLAGVLKSNIKDAYVYFLASSYTEAIVRKSSHVDEFLNWNEIEQTSKLPEADCIVHVFPNKKVSQLAKSRRIPIRIGTSHRIFHWWTCNKLVNFTRKKSDLHESQLNTKLLKPVGINQWISLQDLDKLISWTRSPPKIGIDLLTNKINVVLHTKSKGSAMEWPLSQYEVVIRKLPADQFHFFISGTQEEGQTIWSELPAIFDHSNVTDITGKFTLKQFVSFIEQCDGLMACSTGPLHIASAAGIQALGLYPSQRPMHAGRWGPIGPLSSFLEDHHNEPSNELKITVSEVTKELMKWKKL